MADGDPIATCYVKVSPNYDDFSDDLDKGIDPALDDREVKIVAVVDDEDAIAELDDLTRDRTVDVLAVLDDDDADTRLDTLTRERTVDVLAVLNDTAATTELDTLDRARISTTTAMIAGEAAADAELDNLARDRTQTIFPGIDAASASGVDTALDKLCAPCNKPIVPTIDATTLSAIDTDLNELCAPCTKTVTITTVGGAAAGGIVAGACAPTTQPGSGGGGTGGGGGGTGGGGGGTGGGTGGGGGGTGGGGGGGSGCMPCAQQRTNPDNCGHAGLPSCCDCGGGGTGGGAIYGPNGGIPTNFPGSIYGGAVPADWMLTDSQDAALNWMDAASSSFSGKNASGYYTLAQINKEAAALSSGAAAAEAPWNKKLTAAALAMSNATTKAQETKDIAALNTIYAAAAAAGVGDLEQVTYTDGSGGAVAYPVMVDGQPIGNEYFGTAPPPTGGGGSDAVPCPPPGVCVAHNKDGSCAECDTAGGGGGGGGCEHSGPGGCTPIGCGGCNDAENPGTGCCGHHAATGGIVAAACGGVIGGCSNAAGGGTVTGGIPGEDSVLVNTMPGELIVPTAAVPDVLALTAPILAAYGVPGIAAPAAAHGGVTSMLPSGKGIKGYCSGGVVDESCHQPGGCLSHMADGGVVEGFDEASTGQWEGSLPHGTNPTWLAPGAGDPSTVAGPYSDPLSGANVEALLTQIATILQGSPSKTGASLAQALNSVSTSSTASALYGTGSGY